MSRLPVGWLCTIALAAIHVGRAHADASKLEGTHSTYVEQAPVVDSASRHKPRGNNTGRIHEELPLSFGLDLVLGFGKTPVMTTLPSATPGYGQQARVLETAHVMTQSLVLVGSYETSERMGFGVRWPLTFGTASPSAFTPRSVFAMGNVELEGDYVLPLASHARITFVLGVALPTAQGREVPSHEELRHEQVTDPAHELDRGSIQRAADSLRGFEDEALFELHRVGIVPKVALDYRLGKFLLRPYAKLENLFSTEGADMVAHPVVVEVVLATYLGLTVNDAIDLGARFWGDFALVGNGPTVAVVEPQLSAHIGHVGLAIGGIWPFAGGLTRTQFGGVRALISAHI
ncbi:MAG: hypothetical protein ABW321_04140 [Polyangiales bacterium]